MSLLLRLEREIKDFLKSTSNSYVFLSILWELKRNYVHTLPYHTRFQTEMDKMYTRFQTKRGKNPTLWGGTCL